MTPPVKTLLSLAAAASLSPLPWAAHAQQGPTAAASPPAAAASAPPAARPVDPTALKPFAEVTRDAKRDDGYLAVWRKDEKAWLELAPEQLGQPLLLAVNIRQALGERGLYASQMGPHWVVEFRRIGNTVQLVALNTSFRGGTDLATQLAVRQAFSESLIGAGPVLSAPHPDRKSILVDAGFLLSDIAGYSTALEAAYRMSYNLDRGNSHFEQARAQDRQTSLEARLHFATARLPAPPLMPPPVPTPTPPTTPPDPRSFFIGVTYNFVKLPDQPMAARAADPRLGHFTEAYTDFGTDTKPQQRVHVIKRWRVEKKDPSAAMSEPVQPITFWLDRNIPTRYRAAVEAGVLEWNKAFERIGIRQALVVRQQSDDADFDTLDGQHASIRWFLGVDAGFARGPSMADPRTGEILDADISLSDVFARGARRFMVEDQRLSSQGRLAQLMSARHASEDACDHTQAAAEQMHFALDLLEARGDLEPDSPDVERFVHEVIKDTVTHEVGHTLGLKHNFKASTTITRAQLRDASFTRLNGLSSSVMDYVPYNLSLRGEAPAELNQSTLGAYDYWAIEYAYKPIELATEAAELARIAGRSTEPLLAFADDADADGPNGVDPTVNRFDLGDDPLAWYQRRVSLSRELWQRAQARTPQVGEDPLRSRRMLLSGFRQLRDMPALVSKYVGGLHIERQMPGLPGQPAYRAVEPERQREALRFLADSIFSVDSFRFRPEFLASVQSDYQEWVRTGPVSIPTLVAQLQTSALDRLMSAGTAQRVLEQPAFLPESRRKQTLSLDEVYGTLQGAVWAELKAGSEVDAMRRTLQREHLKRVQTLLTRGAPNMPADALSLVRWHAGRLQADLRAAGAKPGLSVETRAHLQESLGSLSEALKASMSRS